MQLQRPYRSDESFVELGKAFFFFSFSLPGKSDEVE